jgi:hypothetical protein
MPTKGRRCSWPFLVYRQSRLLRVKLTKLSLTNYVRWWPNLLMNGLRITKYVFVKLRFPLVLKIATETTQGKEESVFGIILAVV